MNNVIETLVSLSPKQKLNIHNLNLQNQRHSLNIYATNRAMESESDDMKIQVWPLTLNQLMEWNLIEFKSTVKCQKNGSKKLYMLFQSTMKTTQLHFKQINYY